VAPRVGGIEPGGERGPELADHVGSQQLPLPVGRQAKSEQLQRGEHVDRLPGVELAAQELELGRRCLRRLGGGVNAGAVRVELGANGRVQLLRLPLGDPPQAKRPHQPVGAQSLGAGDLRQPTRRHPPVQLELPQPVLTVAEALAEP
jgi:hypothetical protein